MAEEDMKESTPQTPDEIKETSVGYSPGKKARLVGAFTAALGVGVASSVPPVGAQEEGGEVPAEVIDTESESAGASIEAESTEADVVAVEIALAPESAVNLIAPTRANIVVNSAVSRTGWTREDTATFDTEANQVKDWIISLSQVYDQIGDPELQRAMQVYISAMGTRRNPVPDYAMQLPSNQNVISEMYPSFKPSGANVTIFNFFGLQAVDAGRTLRYEFRFYPYNATEANDPSQSEQPIFSFLHDVLLFEKYSNLVATLPDRAFADIPALVRWLNSDDVKFRLDADVYDKIPEIYDKASPRIQGLGITGSKFYSDIYKRWKFYSNLPNSRIPAGYDRRIYTYQWVNDNLYGGKYKDRLRFNNVSPGEKTLESFLKPLDIPW